MRIVYVNDANDMIPLGRVGENAAVQVQFNVAGWAATYGTGVFELMVLNPHDYNPYIVSVTGSDENNVTWTVTDVSTAYSGIGQVQLNYYVDSTVVKSAIWKTQILPSITAEGPTDPPDPYESWIDTLAELGAETERNAGIAVGAARDAGAFAGAAETSAQNAETSAAQAGRSADAAAASAVEAAGYESNASGYAQTAGTSAETASGYATLAESYAHGDTGARSGEATDNAQYYSDRAAQVVTVLTTETLPNAIAAVQDEGATQAGYVAAEGTSQIGLVSAEGTAQVEAVDAAGAAQVSAVEDEGTRQIGLVEDEGLVQKGVVQDEATYQKGLVSAEGTLQVEAVQNEGTTQKGLVSDEGTAQIALVAEEGSEQVGAVQDEGSTQIGAVQSEGTLQIGAVQDEGSTQVGAVQGEGLTQIGAVQAEGSAQVGAVEDAGASVIATVQSHSNDAAGYANASAAYATSAAASAAQAQSAKTDAANYAARAAEFVGAPLTASTAAQMTDAGRIYVYTGSESGYVNGDWYYFTGTSWAPGGVYNAATVDTDTTLSVSGKPADALVTGTDIRSLQTAEARSTVSIYPSLSFEQGTIANNGSNSESTTRIRLPISKSFQPIDCVDPYLTVTINNSDFSVKIQEYDAYPSASSPTHSTGNYTTYKNDTYTFDVNPSYYYRIAVLKAGGGDIEPSDVSEGDIVVSWQAATDKLLTSDGKPADAKATGNAIAAEQVNISFTLTEDKYIAYATGILTTSTSGYSATDYLPIAGYKAIWYKNVLISGSSSTSTGMAFYDSHYAFISGKSSIVNGDSAGYQWDTVSVPTGAAYARFTARGDTDTYGNLRIYGKSAIDVEFDNLTSTLSVVGQNGQPLDLVWTQGSISTSAGSAIEADNRVKTLKYHAIDGVQYFACNVPDGFMLAYRRYTRDNSFTFDGYSDYKSGFFVIDNASFNHGLNLYRFVFRRLDNEDLTPSDVPSDLSIVPVYFDPWDSRACGKAIPTRTTQRCNPTLVAEMIAVADSYYDHRNDKTGNIYDMTYGYSTCIQTSDYTREIDCSTFAQLVIRGWSYEETQYYTKTSGNSYPANPDVLWAVNPSYYKNLLDLASTTFTLSKIRTASQLAQWMIDQGRMIPLDPELANLEPGDLIFYANTNDAGRPVQPDR